MATPTLLQHATGAQETVTADTSQTFQLPEASQASNCLLVAVQSGNGVAGTPAITDDKGNTWSVLGDVNGGQRLTILGTFGCSAGTRKITVTPQSSTAFLQCEFLGEWNNIATSSAQDSTASTSASASSPVKSGTLTTTADGDLIIQMIVDVTTGPPTGITGYTADSGFTLLGTSNIVGTACQYGIQTTHGAINPGITVAQSGSDSFATITIALKNASAGTARPANMLTVGELHIPAYASVITTTMTIQYPTFGNLLVARFLTFSVAAAATVSTITDNKGNVWHNRAGPVSGLNEVQNEIWSADNATTGSDYTMTVTWGASLAGTTGGDTHIVLDDVINAGVFDVGATNTGTQSSAGNLDTVVITPTTSGGKIFCEGDIFSHTASGTAGAAISDIYVSPVFDGGGNDLDEDALWAHIDNTDTTAKTFTFTIQHNTTGVQGWGAVAAAFKLPVANNQIWLIKA